MTTSPITPRLLKGALVGLDLANPVASVIAFQYNPDTMTRRVEARATGGEGGDKIEAFALKGPPKESFNLSIEIDAADQVDSVNPANFVAGIYPTLSALEMLLYPKSITVIRNAALARIGHMEIIAPEAPLTLFVWGLQRVLPVRLTSLSITEDAYDGLLNPIRAKVDLSLMVLSYADVKLTHLAYNLFLVHQVIKEAMATTNVVNSAQNIGGGLKFF